MKFVALVSGGKDSIYSITKAIQNGHELVACVHLGAPVTHSNNSSNAGNSNDGEEEEESYMYQTAASEVLTTLVEECIGVPLLLHPRVGKSLNTSMVYDGSDAHDEVEDLFVALRTAQQRFNVTAVSSGAILSNYQRVRIENVCGRLGLTSLSYLWRLADQKHLLQQMLEDGIEAVLVRTACPPGLLPQRHLNKSLNVLWMSGLLQRMHKQYQFHMCGEGGEYESLVIDAPLYKKRLVFDEVEVVETDDEVGYLRIHKCHAEPKEGGATLTNVVSQASNTTDSSPSTSTPTSTAAAQPTPAATVQAIPTVDVVYLPHFKQVEGGLWQVSEIMAPVAALDPLQQAQKSEVDLAVQEACQVFAILKNILQRNGCNAQDVMMVHLYLSEISHFASINGHYRECFGTLLPPSRSCVAVGKNVLPGGRRVMLDCLIQCGSGLYMRTAATDTDKLETNEYAMAAHANTTSKLREVLHVQSISQWAPICVGPYSQVNTIRSSLHFMAGQIGLIPSTMKLRPTWTQQLEQCWTNAASVLDALDGGGLQDVLSGLVYVAGSIYCQDATTGQQIQDILQAMIAKNGGITAGKIDSPLVDDDNDELYGGYEDEGTWREMEGANASKTDDDDGARALAENPLLLVSIPEMPVGAQVEVELVVLAKTIRELGLEINTCSSCVPCSPLRDPTPAGKVAWDTGHTFAPKPRGSHKDIMLEACTKSVGHGSVASVFVTASTNSHSHSGGQDSATSPASSSCMIQPDDLLLDMLKLSEKVLADCRSGMAANNVLNIRLYFLASKYECNGDDAVDATDAGASQPMMATNDGSALRQSLAVAITGWTKSKSNTNHVPATTVVPVQGIELLPSKQPAGHTKFLAMHLTLLDPVHFETEAWVHKERPRV